MYLGKFGGTFGAGLMEIPMRCWTLAVHQSLITVCPHQDCWPSIFGSNCTPCAWYNWAKSYSMCWQILSTHGSFHHLQILLQIVMLWILLDFSHLFSWCFAWSSMRSSILWIRASGVGKDHQTTKLWMHQTATLTNQCLKQSCTKQIFQLGIIKCTTIITKFQRQ